MIRNATLADAQQICDIYNHYVLNTAITFEEESVAVREMEHRIEDYTKAYPWLVFEDGSEVLGYCYATKWRVRPAYASSAETTVYVRKDHGGKGIGSALYGELIDRTAARGLHALVAGIALPNAASQGLHEKMGFRKVAHFEEIGKKFGSWIDVGYWERFL